MPLGLTQDHETQRLGNSGALETQIMNCTKPGDSIIAYFDVWILNKISWILGGGVAYMGAGLRRRPQKTPRKSFVLAPVPPLPVLITIIRSK